MEQTFSKLDKLKQFSTILFPILITQIALYLMNFFDTVMSGQISAVDLAGVAIGSSLWLPIFTGITGILMALTPIVSQLIGGKKRERVPFSIIQGLYLALVIGIVVIILGAFLVPLILNGMDLEPTVREIAYHYLIALSLGIIPLLMYSVLRSFIDALGQTRVTMIITLISLPLNVFFNYIFIYGRFGFPKLGGVGAGLASAVTYWIIFLISLYVIKNVSPFSTYRLFKTFFKPAFSAWKEILIIGVPIGLAIFFETSIFAAVTLLLSKFSTETIAAHQAAINFASLLYMIPLSIAMALTIAVGHEVGAKRLHDASQYSYLGISMAVGMSILSGIILLIFREQVSYLYTDNPVVAKLTQQFLIYAIFFQLSDALQAPIQGALRGYKDVNTAFVMSLISYWVIGLPVGYLTANYTSLGPFGYWLGLISGLGAGAIGLSIRLIIVQRRSRLIYKKQS